MVERMVDRLRVRVFADRGALGAAAGRDAAERIRLLQKGGRALRIIFAAAPSQNEMLGTLVKEPGIDWSSITAFHMDEYIGLAKDAPQRFGNFLRERIFDRLPFKAVHLIDSANDAKAECAR